MMGRTNGRTEVRVLLVGDPGVGKTSLILSLVSEEFPPDVPPRAEEITIPADVTPEKVPTHIVDFSLQEQNIDQLEQEILRANVVCIVYTVDDDDTINRITSYWLPLIRDQLGEEHSTPVVLVGNKTDRSDYSSLEMVTPIMNTFSEVETCVECSAKTLKNISELFYYAQKAVLHPTGPLYTPAARDLTDRCKQALTRVFKICDEDNDNVLNDREMDAFQRRCFNTPLEEHALRQLKELVAKQHPEGVSVESDGSLGGLTLSGFHYLHRLFIQRGRHETTWSVLRRFGYDDNLYLSRDYLCPKLRAPPGTTTELTGRGYQFLRFLVKKFDRDMDGSLAPQELNDVFAICPVLPWGPELYNTVCTNEKNWITAKGFLAQWTLTTALDVNKTLEYLAYLGYMHYSFPPCGSSTASSTNISPSPSFASLRSTNSTLGNERTSTLSAPSFNGGGGEDVFHSQGQGNPLQQEESQLSAVQVTRDKQIDLQLKQTMRNVFHCHVIGPQGAGKTSFLQGFLDRSLEQVEAINRADLPRYTINSVPVYAQEKYLLLQEIDIFGMNDNLTPPELHCDVVCLMFDSSYAKSFEYIGRIYTKYFANTKVPVLVVASKCDRVPVRQDYVLQPGEFCAKYKLPPPQQFSCIVTEHNRDIYVKLATMAAYPNLRRLVHVLQSRPSWITEYTGDLVDLPPDVAMWVKAGLGAAAVTIMGVLLMRMLRTPNGS